ncbi:MAG: hypothetical protein ACRD3W_32195 [Terriglobales bacterium]
MKISLAMTVLAICIFATAAPAADKISASSLTPGMVSQSKSTSKTALNMKALHRMDFLVTGKSCATCLLGIQRRMTSTPGVARAAVMLKKPYAAVCIYDFSQLKQDLILKNAKGNERQVKFEQIEDAPIDKLPVILLPKDTFK